MDFQQFYPTPAELGERLAKMIEEPQLPILEPSAGTGNLIQAMITATLATRNAPLLTVSRDATVTRKPTAIANSTFKLQARLCLRPADLRKEVNRNGNQTR